MELTWVEDNESRSASIVRLGRKAQSTYVKSWKIFGSADDVEVHANVNAQLTANFLYWQYPNQPLNQLQADHYTLDYLGDDAWQLKVTYVKDGAEDDEQTDPLRRTRSFDTSGGTSHVTQGIVDAEFTQGEQRYWASGTAAPNMNGAIGVDGDSVAGVDIVVPSLQWTENYDVPASYVTAAYIKSLGTMTGTVNNAAFRTFRSGEVLFLGASGSQEWDEQKGDGPWTLTYKFAYSPNAGSGETLPAIKVGSITNITKKGHEYLWVRYESAVDSNDLVKRPKYVYVNRVYRQSDFASLGIGVA